MTWPLALAAFIATELAAAAGLGRWLRHHGGHMDTPIADQALAAAIAEQCRIEIAMEDWRAEVAALADIELAELIEGERP